MATPLGGKVPVQQRGVAYVYIPYLAGNQAVHTMMYVSELCTRSFCNASYSTLTPWPPVIYSALTTVHEAYTVHRKMFAINNFREFREWSTFANIIIANFYVRTHTVY